MLLVNKILTLELIFCFTIYVFPFHLLKMAPESPPKSDNLEEPEAEVKQSIIAEKAKVGSEASQLVSSSDYYHT